MLQFLSLLTNSLPRAPLSPLSPSLTPPRPISSARRRHATSAVRKRRRARRLHLRRMASQGQGLYDEEAGMRPLDLESESDKRGGEFVVYFSLENCNRLLAGWFQVKMYYAEVHLWEID